VVESIRAYTVARIDVLVKGFKRIGEVNDQTGARPVGAAGTTLLHGSAAVAGEGRSAQAGTGFTTGSSAVPFKHHAEHGLVVTFVPKDPMSLGGASGR
jgi:hypothetical protein